VSRLGTGDWRFSSGERRFSGRDCDGTYIFGHARPQHGAAFRYVCQLTHKRQTRGGFGERADGMETWCLVELAGRAVEQVELVDSSPCSRELLTTSLTSERAPQFPAQLVNSLIRILAVVAGFEKGSRS
jgi:hypothetical protein